MNNQILSSRLLLTAFFLICVSSEVGAESVGIRGSLNLIRPMKEMDVNIIGIERHLEEGGGEGDNDQKQEEGNEKGEEENAEEQQDADAAEEEAQEEAQEEEEEVAEYYYYDEASEADDVQYAYAYEDEEEEEEETSQSKIEDYQAQAAQLFETAPAEWNSGQWDLLFALFGSVLVSCCVLSAFFAYCCIFREDDGAYMKMKRGRSLRKRRRRKDDETVSSEWTKDASLLPSSTSGSRTFTPRSWVSGSTFMSSSNDEKSYSAPIATVTSSPSSTDKSGTFARVDEGDILSQNSTVPHQNTGVTMKSETGDM